MNCAATRTRRPLRGCARQVDPIEKAQIGPARYGDAPESNLILGAAVVDDILGLIVLAIVLGLVHAADAGGAIEISAGRSC